MHRVELKAKSLLLVLRFPLGFLMHRVELKETNKQSFT